MTTPWERELAEKKKQDENAYTSVKISTATAEDMRKNPRVVFFASTAMIIAVALTIVILLIGYTHTTVFPASGYSRRHGTLVHPALAVILVLLPLAVFFSAVFVRRLIMKGAASEISRKVARKIKCGPEFEKAIFNMVLKAPWSSYRVSSLTKRSSNVQLVVTELGESRTIEFSHDLSTVIVGPQKWQGRKGKTYLDELLENKDYY